MDKKIIDTFRQDTKEMQKLLTECTFLKFDDESKMLNDILTDLNSPLQIMVMGAFSTGKSSFINALFGEEIAMVGALPTTAAITKLSYGNNKDVTVHFLDGTTKKYPADNFAQMTTENNSQWKQLQPTISFIERTLPKDILKNINLIDSPGLEAITAIHTRITKKFLNRADVVFWMFTAENVGTDTEIKEIKKLDFRLKPVAVINKMDLLDEEEDAPEEFIQDAEKKLQGMVRGVVGISAQLALEAKKTANTDDGNIKAVEDIIANQIVPQSEEYKIASFINNMTIFMFDFSGKFEKYKKYIKNTLESDEYETAKRNLEQLDSQLVPYIKKIVEYADSLDEDNPATGAAALFLSRYFDEEDGLKLCQFSAEKNNLIAQVMLATVYFQMGTPEAIEKFEYWANIANENYIEDTNIPAMEGMIQFLLGGLNGIKGNDAEALSFLEKAVSNKAFEAANVLGNIYYTGYIGYKAAVPVDYDKAFKYFKIAAEYDIPAAQSNLGFLYFEGLGTEKDEKLALKWTRASANNGYPTAQFLMANFYEKGKYGLSVNFKEAVKWYERYAENILAVENTDNDDNLFDLIEIYVSGKENPETNEKIQPNYKKGVALAEKILSRHGSKEHNEFTFYCMSVLDKMYNEGGYGIKENKILALQWSRTGANAGDPVCQWNTACDYANKGDFNNARLWVEKSASQGYEPAIKYLATLNSEMNKPYDRNSLPPADNSNEEPEIKEFNTFTELFKTIVMACIFPPLGFIYGFYMFFIEMPKINKAIEERKKRGN